MSTVVLMPPNVRTASSVVTRRADATRWIAGLHDELTSFFGRLDRGGTFAEDRWERPGGGGGVARVMTDGVTFEKAGINRSAVMGELPAAAARRLGGQGARDGATHFFATGVSLVVHPRSPKVPTVHLNVRYFELTDAQGQLIDSWLPLSLALNSLNRAMGQHDLYPFVLSPPAIEKLGFIHRLVHPA